MMKLKYALRGISRESLFTLFLVFQLIFAFYTLYNTLEIRSQVHTESLKIYKYFEDKKIYNLQQTSDNLFDMDKYPKVNEDNLKKSFYAVRNSPSFSFSYQVLFPIAIEVFQGDEEFKMYPPEFKYEDKNFFQANNITLDEQTLKRFDIKLNTGRLFSAIEYNRDFGDSNSLPVLLGARYAKYFKVGDEITYLRPDFGLMKARVIGIMEENQFIPVQMMAFDYKRYVNMDNNIISTCAQFENDKIMYDTMFNSNFLYYDKKNSDIAITDINNDIKKIFLENLGINVDIKCLNKYIQAELDTFKSQEKIVSITSLTIFIYITITLILSTLYSIFKRKKEFGIHIFSGGTLGDIAMTIYLETLLVLLFSFLAAMIVINSQNTTLNFENVSLLFLNLIIISIITTILPIIKLLRSGVADIIKEVG